MTNPYASPKSSSQGSPAAESAKPDRDVRGFLAWYFGAFLVAQLLWHLSSYVRAMDFLELPMAAAMCPVAGFLDPHDFLVNDPSAFLYGIAFWGALIPVVLFLPRWIKPLLFALVVIGLSSAASMVYAYLVVFGSGPVP